MNKLIVLFVATLVLMTLVSSDVINLTVRTFSADNLPIENVNVSLYNFTNALLIGTNFSNGTGNVTFFDVNTTNYPYLAALLIYPSSAYTVSLINASCDDVVYLNDFGSVSVIVTNTLGEFLEAQDGSVFVTEAANFDKKIIVFNTSCRTGEQFIDDDGNWVSFTQCPVSDSRGNYNFVFPVREKDGFFYDESYTVHVVINGIMESCNFTTALPRHVDSDKWAALGKQLGGVLFLIMFVVLFYFVLRRLKK